MIKTSIKITFFGLFLILPLTLGSIVHAEDFKSITSLNLDTSSAIKEDKGFNIPTKILVTPIRIDSKKVIFKDWIKGIYYYTVDKLGFQDIPYHYIVSENGDIFVANSSGDEKQITIDELGANNVVIGYLNTSGNDYINPEAETSLANLLLDISNRNSINPQNIYVSGTKFVKDKSTNTITINSQKLGDSWSTNITKIVNTFKDKYVPSQKSYVLDINEVAVTTEEVNPGTELTVSVKLKNSGNFGMYQGSSSEIILTKSSDNASSFYVNNSWLSQTQTSIMEDSDAILPGREKSFEFKIKAPLAVGTYSETFTLKTLSGGAIKLNKNVDITLKLKKTDKQIIQIKNTGADFINVRKDPNSGTVLRKVTAGERFFLIDLNQDTLWAEIDLGDGTTGYIAAWQFSYL